MNISAELVAIAILGVSLVSLGWKVSSDIRRELKQKFTMSEKMLPDLAIALATWNSAWPDWKAGWRVALQRNWS